MTIASSEPGKSWAVILREGGWSVKQKSPFFIVDGHEVSATFQNEKNPGIVDSLKQALVASYINGKQNSVCTFASQEESEYDGKGGNADAP